MNKFKRIFLHRKPTRNLFRPGVADILHIDPLQLRGRFYYAVVGEDVWVSGAYRKDGHSYHYTVNINSGQILINEQVSHD